jgi:membrane-associated phospholipid phosphatase
MDQTAFLQWLTSQQHPVLNGIATVLTFLGGEDFYLLAVPIMYWCFSKQLGFRLFYTFALSMYVNSFLKVIIANPRPVGVEGVQSLLTETAGSNNGYPNDSFPSGHAQGTTTFWAYLSARVRERWVLALGVLMIVLVSCSRMFLGLHWPTDVLGGIGVGLAVFLLALVIERFLSSPAPLLKWLLLIGVPVVLYVIFPKGETAKIMGVLLGAGVGHMLEESKVRMGIPSGWLNRIVAMLIGVAGVFLLKSGLKAAFPAGELYDMARYACMGLWVFGIAPWLFVALRLYGLEGRSFRHYP